MEERKNSFGAVLTNDYSTYEELEKKYGIIPSEIIQIDLNRSGIYLPNGEVRENYRVRYKGEISGSRNSWFALPVRSKNDTPFSATAEKINFKDIQIGSYDELRLDTCESSYQRGPNLLNLNSRSRSNCGGCRACVHNYHGLYDQTVIKDRKQLITTTDIDDFFTSKKLDVSKLTQIAVVTGLFGSEENVISHMKLVNEVAKQRGFQGELMYFGCEVNSERALDELAKLDNSAIIYALDNFTKRDLLLNKTKALITLEKAKRTLEKAKRRGIETTISYISGIDSLKDMSNGFTELKDALTRFPVVNIYQIQTPQQASIMNEEAANLEYYIKTRIELEKIFAETGFRPKRWENYRPLWYDTFGSEILPSNSYGECEKIKRRVRKP